jgi:hypothetical protein
MKECRQEEQVRALSAFYKEEENSIVLAYLSDKRVNELENEELALEAMKIAEDKLKSKGTSKRK